MAQHSLVLHFLIATVLVICISLSMGATMQPNDGLLSSQARANTRGGTRKMVVDDGEVQNAGNGINTRFTRISSAKTYFLRDQSINSGIHRILQTKKHPKDSKRSGRMLLSNAIAPTQASLSTDENRYYQGELIDVTFTMNPALDNLEYDAAWIGLFLHDATTYSIPARATQS